MAEINRLDWDQGITRRGLWADRHSRGPEGVVDRRHKRIIRRRRHQPRSLLDGLNAEHNRVGVRSEFHDNGFRLNSCIICSCFVL